MLANQRCEEKQENSKNLENNDLPDGRHKQRADSKKMKKKTKLQGGEVTEVPNTADHRQERWRSTQIENLTTELNNSTRQVIALEREKQDSNRQVQDLTAQLQEKEKQLEEKNKQLEERSKQLFWMRE